ncbi:MAG: ABC transporter ATP-binding protein [Acidimicrobiia bacterium]|nr:ABC transporter ATP-binding protein [Acidimicrobiia bacterium]
MSTPNQPDLAIEVRGLTKSYGDLSVLHGIDLHVAKGEIVAFLGPNGAGKTTAIEILEGYRSRDSGEVRVLGQDPANAPLSWREDIGIVVQESEQTAELTAAESLAMHAGYYRNPRDPAAVLELVGLAGSADQRTRKLSGGQKRRLDLGMALVGNPELVFLDEPTTGFDPSARRESWGLIEALRDLGKTVLLTTHYMDEAEQLADRIVVIANGRIVAGGTAAELAAQVDARSRVSWRHRPDQPAPPADLGWSVLDANELAVLDIGPADGAGDAEVLQRLHRLLAWALDNGVDLPELEVKRPTLEDVYLELTDHGGVRGPGDPPAPSDRPATDEKRTTA